MLIPSSVQRIAVLGADARVDLVEGGGERLTARLRREELDDLELARGEIVWASADHVLGLASAGEIGRASCRERVSDTV